MCYNFPCTQKQLKECIQLLDDYKHGTLPPGVSSHQVSTDADITEYDMTCTSRLQLRWPVHLWLPMPARAVVGGPEDQAGKWMLAEISRTPTHWGLRAPERMRTMSRSLHTGHHSSRHRREDLHAISNVRYDLWWRSSRQKNNHLLAFQLWTPFLVQVMYRSEPRLWVAHRHHTCNRHISRNSCRSPSTQSCLEMNEMRLWTYFAPK